MSFELKGGIEVKKAACWFCYQNCGMLVYVKNGEIIKVEGDPDHPINKGAMCPRPHTWREFLYHPQRVNYPLKRVGERGEGKFKRISWNEALDEIAAKLKELKEKYGPECVASVGGTNRTDDWARRRFFNLFGSPNICHIAHVCWLPTFIAETVTYGWYAVPDIPNTKLIVAWGRNSGSNNLPEMRGILDAKENNNAKLIVIDPRLSELASKADMWLRIRPASDGALALAWINVIINEGLYDREFVEKYCYGFEKLREHVQQYTPEWAEKVTWIPKDDIIESARMYATIKPATMIWGSKNEHMGSGSSSLLRARAILKAITGNLNKAGGNLILGPNTEIYIDSDLELNELLPPEQRAKQLGSDRFKMMSWPAYEVICSYTKKFWGKTPPAEWCCEAHPSYIWRAALTGKPYPIKAIIVVASNPLLSYGNSKLVYQALKSVELLVTMDFWITPTAMLSDYVLPAASWLERPIATSSFGTSNFLILSERAVQPLYERRTDFDFWRELGIRLGQEQYWPWKTLEEAYEYRLEPLGLGMSLSDFVHYIRMHSSLPKVTDRFATPTGKVELYSTILEKMGYEPLPTYKEPPMTPYSNPELAKEYPLILVAGIKFMPFHHSEQRQIQALRRMHPDPLCHINPDTARSLGISDGDWIWIETLNGRIKQRAFYNVSLHPQVVCAEASWWYPEKPGPEPSLFGAFESNVNLLTDDDPEALDQAYGCYYYTGLLCKVYKAEDQPST
ncbi:MAG: molybdopterin-dependent oxidoreductase [Candidatus Nezhaarchaeota archaeon]|nr:molybdopterin-dependent oxidoreductase [Candidatus Nezhaarchaeota archaeon]MCX8142272.1 molybdopterin-dependent oxidoreductase [Candidatus Nezhaarchaeota archaeon]MDW8050755.1 molybdopterin-dependent oxidoreductase [Nitrososphaerota archaeon]